ncbi:hypothetical protein ACHAW5_000774 [Stephanodiscus triporus]|uniref:Secreted protein n=1 Tax=Stephanodiscus triporus TaxID=2934178 RepID=A0ABD3QLU4_9STRA
MTRRFHRSLVGLSVDTFQILSACLLHFTINHLRSNSVEVRICNVCVLHEFGSSFPCTAGFGRCYWR